MTDTWYADNSNWSYSYDQNSEYLDVEGEIDSHSATVYGEEVSVSVNTIAEQSDDICASNSTWLDTSRARGRNCN